VKQESSSPNLNTDIDVAEAQLTVATPELLLSRARRWEAARKRALPVSRLVREYRYAVEAGEVAGRPGRDPVLSARYRASRRKTCIEARPIQYENPVPGKADLLLQN